MKDKLLVGLAAAALAVIPATSAIADSHLGSLSVITEAISVETDDVEVVAVHGVPPETFDALGVDSTAVDIYVNDDLLLTLGPAELVNGSYAIVPAGSEGAALEVGTVDVPEGTVVLAYAVGQLPPEDADDAEEMEAPEQEHLPGEAGLAATSLPTWVVALMALGALTVAAPVVARKRN